MSSAVFTVAIGSPPGQFLSSILHSILCSCNPCASKSASVEAYGESVVLASLAPSNVDRWVTDQRKKGLVEDGISSRLAALKVFSNRFIFKHLELQRWTLWSCLCTVRWSR